MRETMVGRGVSGALSARLVPWIVLALGLATTGVLFGSVAAAGQRRHNDEIEREIVRLREEANDTFRRQVSVLDAVAGAYSADPNFDQSKFDRFYEELKKGEDAAIPEAIGVSLWRPWAQREELAVEAKRRGATNYRLRPSYPRPEAHAVVLLVPLDKLNAVAPGYDMHADPIRREAMDLAWKLKRAVSTKKIYLAKDPSTARRPSFIVYLPLKASAGFVYSGLHADKLLRSLFQTAAGDHVGLRLWCGPRKAEDLVYERPLSEPIVDQRSFTIDLRGVSQSLQAEIVVSKDFGFPATIRPWILPLGTAISLLLFLLATNLGRAREESERQSAEQTLLAEVGRLTTGSTEFGDEALWAVATATAHTFDAICRIDIYDEAGTLRTISTRSGGAEAIAAIEREYPRTQSDPLFRRALATGRPQRAAVYEAIDERHRTLIEALRGGPVLIVPFRLGERALGALTLVRRPGEAGFSAEAAALGEAIAGRVALALDNARLYRDLEQRVEERTRDLEASNRELESFCYSVSHDLRTPLRSLDGFGRVLKEDYGDRLDELGNDYLNRILAATKRMDELITALLTLSRLTRREIVPTDVDVTAMAEDQLNDLDRESRIRVEVEPGLRVRADSRMLAVLFDNLLSNAVKFSSRTERPVVTVGRAGDGSIFVRDNGAGFDMAYANKLFQPFERLHSAREFPGHGIGLATVERIVRRHGGEVRAEGRPGEGATFYVKFPD